ncbi:MAG: hypothetical protein R6V35_05745 [Candidatus Nanohaloarchaea archaeon]
MKNSDIPWNFIPNRNVELGRFEENHRVSEEFMPDEEKVIGYESDGETGYESDTGHSPRESFSSLFSYLNKVAGESRFELSQGIEGFRGSSFLYEDDNSVLVISDSEDDIGIDLFNFEDGADLDSVKEWLYEGPEEHYPDAQNELHYDVDGQEAFYEVSKIVESNPFKSDN